MEIKPPIRFQEVPQPPPRRIEGINSSCPVDDSPLVLILYDHKDRMYECEACHISYPGFVQESDSFQGELKPDEPICHLTPEELRRHAEWYINSVMLGKCGEERMKALLPRFKTREAVEEFCRENYLRMFSSAFGSYERVKSEFERVAQLARSKGLNV